MSFENSLPAGVERVTKRSIHVHVVASSGFRFCAVEEIEAYYATRHAAIDTYPP
jgi:hypothetical protein